MKKKMLAAILVCAMVLTVVAPMTVFADWEKQADGSWKYYSEGEELYYSGGIREVDGADYYFDADGKMLTGWIKEVYDYGDSTHTVWYYANSSGVLQKNWVKVGKTWYYFDPDNYYMYDDGLYTLSDGNSYFFAAGGAMLTGWIKNVTTYDDGSTYTNWLYADSSGKLAKGWKSIDGKWYYFDEWFKMYSDGRYMINDKAYYFYPNGSLGIGWIKESHTFESGYTYTSWYYADGNGVLQSKWQKINGSWYYFSEYSYEMHSNYQTEIDGKPYAFDANGRMITGWGKISYDYGDGYYDETWYYADGSGILKTGWQYIGNAWYYLDPDYYYMHTGYTEINGKAYMFNGSGVWTTTPGWLEVKYPDSSSTWYYLDANGQPVKGWKYMGGVWYFFTSYSGSMAANGVQYDKDTGKYYAFAANGAWISSAGWQKFTYPNGGTNWIYTKSGGEITTGWEYIGGTWYYFNDPYGYMYTGLQVIDGQIEEFTSGGAWKGTIKTVGWKQIYDSWYYVEDTNGTLAKGWRTINGVKYYFDQNGGVMYSHGRRYIDGNYYFFSESGALMTGWINQWGETYYANSDGVLQSGWQEIDSYKYYFDPDGFEMYYDGVYSIDGADYEFDYDGHCLTE